MAAANLLRTGFNVTTVVVDDIALLRLQGELDMATARDLDKAMLDAIDLDVTGLLLDLTDLTFLDSTGIGILLAGSRRAEASGRSFSLRNPTPRVLRTLRLTGVEDELGLSLIATAYGRPT